MAKPDPIPDWLLERVALDEVPPSRRDEVAERLNADPESEARLEALQESNREILQAIPAEQAAREIEQRHRIALAAKSGQETRGRRPLFSAFMGGAFASALAAAAAVLLLLPDSNTEPTIANGPQEPAFGSVDPDYGERLKGDPRLLLGRKRGEQIDKVTVGTVARAGDLIQIAYLANEQSNGVILSIDGAGVVTLHYPVSPDSSTAIKPTGKVQLEHSYELDDAPSFERFFFITAKHELDTRAILERARELAKFLDHEPERVRIDKLDLTADIRQWSFLLPKENNR